LRILNENTLSVIIDVQERLFPHIYENERLSRNLIILIKGLNLLKIPILVVQQYTKGLGPTIQPLAEALGTFQAIEKNSFSCCDELSFIENISQFMKKNIIIAGIESHVCVQQTVTDLLGLGYIPIVIEDCVASRKENDKKIAIERMKMEGAIIATYESILFELCRFSNTDVFKSISNLLK
jgi:nicotinamidase-related amidase